MGIKTAPLLLLFISLCGCFPWGSRASHKLPETTALDRSYAYDGEVIVVGAGAAGLAAARVLADNNISYTVLEARSRYGGRLAEDTEFTGVPIDLGAEWIHNTPQVLDVLSGEPGTADSLDLIPYQLETGAQWNGTTLTDVPKAELDGWFEFFPEYKFKDSTWFDFARTHYGRHVEDRIRYETPVASIDHAGDRVEITAVGGEQFVADKVLVTVPIGVLQADVIDFRPPLSDRKRDAISAVEFHRGFKLFLQVSEDFYPDAVNCQVEGGEKAYWDVAFGKDVEDNVLGLLVTGAAADAYYELESHDAIVDAVVEELDDMFDGAASAAFTGEYLLRDWGRHEYTRGTWVEGFLIRKSVLRDLNESLAHKVYFAGEAHDVYHQLGVPGAVLSGLHAIDRLLTGQD